MANLDPQDAQRIDAIGHGRSASVSLLESRRAPRSPYEQLRTLFRSPIAFRMGDRVCPVWSSEKL